MVGIDGSEKESGFGSSAGNINAMIRFVITSICDMAGMKILIGSLLGPFFLFLSFPPIRLTVYTLISCCERFIDRSNGSNDG